QALAVPDYSQQPEPGDHRYSSQAVAALRKFEGTGASATEAIALARRYPDAVTESGTPVAGLALLAALRRAGGNVPTALLDEIRRNITELPSFLSPAIVEAAKNAGMTQDWAAQEGVRESTRALVRLTAPLLMGSARP